jgi:hypothetical protein
MFSAERLAKKFSDGEFRLNCAKKTAHSGECSARMGPRVQIPLGPPSSPPGIGFFGESIKIGARARDMRLRMDQENGCGAE